MITVKAAYEESDDHDAASLAKALQDLGEDTIPASIKDTWIGTDGLGFSPEHHSNQKWGSDNFTFVPAQALSSGMWPAP
ncbi:hypothetical protein [Aeromicrobium sp. UC242_57]|uniref:hypothetical protein n=1 Tax=Aeromicrobium sp. UC242_57 TaxID=3374624 RepID=UPI0037BB07D7